MLTRRFVCKQTRFDGILTYQRRYGQENTADYRILDGSAVMKCPGIVKYNRVFPENVQGITKSGNEKTAER